MADEFEQAVLCHFHPTVPQEVRERAAVYCGHVRAAPDAWRFCLERLFATRLVEVKFFCLQVLQDVILHDYDRLAAEQRVHLRTTLFTWLSAYLANHPGEGLPVRNKYAQTLVLLFRREYPHAWPSFFPDLFALLPQGPVLLDMLLRVLNTIDELVVSADVPRSAAELQCNAALKDAMRERCVPDLAALWHQVLVAYHAAAPALALLALQNIRHYVEWIDIQLVANDRLVPLLFRLLDSPELQCEVCECLLELLAKGMEPAHKLALLDALGLEAVIARHHRPAPAPAPASLADAPSEFQLRLARLVDALGTQALECLRALRAAGAGRSAAEASAEGHVDAALQLLFAFLNSDRPDVSAATFAFTAAYLAQLKQQPPADAAKTATQLRALLQVLAARLRQLEGARPTQEDEEALELYRNQLATHFKAVARLAPDVAAAFVGDLLSPLLAQAAGAAAADLKAGLALLFVMSEGLPEEVLRSRPCEAFFGALELQVLQSNVMAHPAPPVAVLAAEVLVRYVRFLPAEPVSALPALLTSFLCALPFLRGLEGLRHLTGLTPSDERGVHHPNERVRRAASKLLLRLVKTLRHRCHPHLALIIQSLQTQLQAGEGEAALGGKERQDEQLALVEAIGSLVASLPASPSSADLGVAHLGNFLAGYVQQLETLAGAGRSAQAADLALLSQNVQCITAFSKGFATPGPPDARAVWRRALAAAVQAVGRAVGGEAQGPLQGQAADCALRVVTLAHRMVDVLGAEVLALLPPLFALALAAPPTQLAAHLLPELVKLCNQLLARLKEAAAPLLEQIYAALLPPVWALAGIEPGAAGLDAVLPPALSQHSSQEQRERLDLARLYLHLLHSIVLFNATALLVTPANAPLLEPLLRTLLAACRHPDLALCKPAVIVLRRLLPLGVLPAAATSASLLLQWLAVHGGALADDASTAQVFAELAKLYREAQARPGGDMLAGRLRAEATAAGIAPAVADALAHTLLAENDQRRFRDFFVELARQLRGHPG